MAQEEVQSTSQEATNTAGLGGMRFSPELIHNATKTAGIVAICDGSSSTVFIVGLLGGRLTPLLVFQERLQSSAIRMRVGVSAARRLVGPKIDQCCFVSAHNVVFDRADLILLSVVTPAIVLVIVFVAVVVVDIVVSIFICARAAQYPFLQKSYELGFIPDLAIVVVMIIAELLLSN